MAATTMEITTFFIFRILSKDGGNDDGNNNFLHIQKPLKEDNEREPMAAMTMEITTSLNIPILSKENRILSKENTE